METRASLGALLLIVGCGGGTVADAGLDGGTEAARDAPGVDVDTCQPNGTVCTDCACDCCSGRCGGLEDGGVPGVDYCKYRCVQRDGVSTCNDEWYPCCPGQGVCDPVTRMCK